MTTPVGWYRQGTQKYERGVPMRKMITAAATGEYIIFRTVARDGQKFRYGCKSPEFYYSREKLLQAIETGQHIIDKDCLNFCSIFCRKNIMAIEFTWLEQGIKPHPHHAWQESIYLELRPFVAWLTDGAKGSYKALDQNDEGKSNRLVFTESAQPILRNILAKPVMRRKLVKALRNNFMRNPMGRTIEFYRDFDEYSFFWQEKLATGENYMHGGLILHRDHNDFDNLEKARYSVHT
jgi:hypothetical protein